MIPSQPILSVVVLAEVRDITKQCTQINPSDLGKCCTREQQGKTWLALNHYCCWFLITISQDMGQMTGPQRFLRDYRNCYAPSASPGSPGSPGFKSPRRSCARPAQSQASQTKTSDRLTERFSIAPVNQDNGDEPEPFNTRLCAQAGPTVLITVFFWIEYQRSRSNNRLREINSIMYRYGRI